MKLVSICIPVYNRLCELQCTLEPLLRNVQDEGDDLYEVIVSINPAEDGKEAVTEYVRSLKEKYDFIYSVLDKHSPQDTNFINATNHASGKYLWIVGDDDLLLNGTVRKVAEILKKHPDVTWIHLNAARISDITKIGKVPVKRMYHVEEGYFQDGKRCAIETHKKIDTSMLFSTSNLYLMSSFYHLLSRNDGDKIFQLASTFLSANEGAAYLVDEICIIAGSNSSWGPVRSAFLAKTYNDYLRAAIGESYSKAEIENLIAYRMRHAALRSWLVIYKFVLCGDKKLNMDVLREYYGAMELSDNKSFGINVLREFYEFMPVETVMISVFLPLIFPYLGIRHYYKKARSLIERYRYLNSKNKNKELAEYMGCASDK